MVRQGGCDVLPLVAGTDLADLARHTGAQAAFLDLRDETSIKEVARLDDAIPTAVYDDVHPRRQAASWAVYPPTPQCSGLNWDGTRTRVNSGWEWIALRSGLDAPRTPPMHPPRVLVTMGGSDPAGFTAPALAALSAMPSLGRITVVLGPAASDLPALASHPDCVIVRNPHDLPALMLSHDLAVASFGTTAYELVAAGVPSVLVCLTSDHRLAAQPLCDLGLATCAGDPGRADPAAIVTAVRGWLDHNLRERAGINARLLCDGRGADRIADGLIRMAQERR